MLPISTTAKVSMDNKKHIHFILAKVWNKPLNLYMLIPSIHSKNLSVRASKDIYDCSSLRTLTLENLLS